MCFMNRVFRCGTVLTPTQKNYKTIQALLKICKLTKKKGAMKHKWELTTLLQSHCVQEDGGSGATDAFRSVRCGLSGYTGSKSGHVPCHPGSFLENETP